jgi:hypothetical protein
MKLFHFTAAHLWPLIQAEGLTAGRVPANRGSDTSRIFLIEGYQWLTQCPDWAQAWCDPKYSRLAYRRDAVRITVAIPDSSRDHLLHWIKVSHLCGPVAHALNMVGNPSDWWLFDGRIQPGWFREIDRNPAICPSQQPIDMISP